MSIPIPQGATRVQVMTDLGKQVWRKPSDVLPTDTIQINPKTGEAYVMFGAPGFPTPSPSVTSSPKATTPSPTANNLSQHQNRKKQKLGSDQVLATTTNTPDSEKVLTEVLVGLAEESASLAFEREEAERRGEATSQISVRRVNALKAVGDTWIKKKEMMSSKSLDLESKAFKKVFGFIAETFRKACDEAGVRPEQSESIFASFGKMVDEQEWMTDAKKSMEEGD
jgi:hypothetical protein